MRGIQSLIEILKAGLEFVPAFLVSVLASTAIAVLAHSLKMWVVNHLERKS